MSDQNKRPIPKEELSAYERWELPAMKSGHIVASGGGRSVRDEEQEPKPLTAEEIEAIRQAAHQEGRAEGHAEGYAAGHQEGLAAARAEVNAQLARLRSIAEALLAPIEAEKAEIEEAMTLLLAQLSRQVVARELSLDANQLRGLVDEAIAALPAGSNRIRIAVSPADLQLFNAYEPELEQECRFRADSAMQPGGCRVETEFSLIDYSVDARFRAAAAGMVGQRFDQLNAMLNADLAELAMSSTAPAVESAAASVPTPAPEPVAAPASPDEPEAVTAAVPAAGSKPEAHPQPADDAGAGQSELPAGTRDDDGR